MMEDKEKTATLEVLRKKAGQVLESQPGSLGDIANAGSVEVVIVVASTSAGTLTNSAVVSADTYDPTGANNSTVEETVVTPVQSQDNYIYLPLIENSRAGS